MIIFIIGTVNKHLSLFDDIDYKSISEPFKVILLKILFWNIIAKLRTSSIGAWHFHLFVIKPQTIYICFSEPDHCCFLYMYVWQVSYMILQKVSPVTHSVGNCVKRVVVIVSSVIFFRTPVSPINSLGN